MATTTLTAVTRRLPYPPRSKKPFEASMAANVETLIGEVLTAYRYPLDYQKRLKGTLPAPFQPVLRLAAGKALPELEALCRRWQTTPLELRRAAVFFIEQACLQGEEDPYRILGLSPPVAPSQIQTHYHLLMLVFHPDRTEATANWRDVYAARVNTAYQQLRRTAGRRSGARSSAVPSAPQSPSGPRPRRRRRAPPQDPLSFLVQRFPRLVRHLPHLILGGGAAVTLGLVFYLYLSRAGEATSTVEETEAPAAAPALAEAFHAVQRVEALSDVVQGGAGGKAEENAKPSVAPPPEPLPEEKPSAKEKAAIQAQRLPSAPETKKAAKPQAPPPVTSTSATKQPATTHAAANDDQNTSSGAATSRPPSQSSASRSRTEAVAAEAPSPKSPVQEPVAAPEKAAIASEIPNSATPLLSPERMQPLLRRFVTAYQDGDLDNFLALFSAGIQTNDYAGKAALQEDYARFFASTQSRELQLKDVQWQVEDEMAEGKGRYVVRVRKPAGTVESQGRIHFQVQARAGKRVITGFFNHVEN